MQKICSNQYLYAFPPFFKDKQGLKKDIPRPSENNVDCSSHNAVPSMVSDPSENVNIEIFCHTTAIKPSSSGISVASKLVSGTRRQGFFYQITIFPGQNGLAGVVKENLIHFYDRFPITGKVLDYLSYLFGSGYEYRIIDCHRSAISAFHEYIGSRLIYTNQ